MALASRGLRDLGSGNERITDEAERSAVRAQAARVQRTAALAALAATLAALCLP